MLAACFSFQYLSRRLAPSKDVEVNPELCVSSWVKPISVTASFATQPLTSDRSDFWGQHKTSSPPSEPKGFRSLEALKSLRIPLPQSLVPQVASHHFQHTQVSWRVCRITGRIMDSTGAKVFYSSCVRESAAFSGAHL